jgi:hypothetical protein
MNMISTMLTRKRPQQPVPMLRIKSEQQGRNTANCVIELTKEAAAILGQLQAPIYIAAFCGAARAGKSKIATQIAQKISQQSSAFAHGAGNIPVTSGIDMQVIGCLKGNLVILDCEGAFNLNAGCFAFVSGLAATLASRLYVFERACFTTQGLDLLMQIVNMGQLTKTLSTKTAVLVENMTINHGISNEVLLHTLLSEKGGDSKTNKLKLLLKSKFQIELCKLPFVSGNEQLFDDICSEMTKRLVDNLEPFAISGLQVDGARVVQMANELIRQIQTGRQMYTRVT